MLAPWKKIYDQPRQHIKKERHYFADKGPFSQSYGFSGSHVSMWELGVETPLDSKEIKLVNPKGNQPWIFIVKTDDEAEAPIL